MLAILMNIIGLIFIMVSLIYITKISRKEKDIYEQMMIIQDNVKDYSYTIENVINSFDDLIETSLSKVENIQGNKSHDFKEKEDDNPELKKDILEESSKPEDSSKALYEKIMDLKNIGLSNEEIAKKLNKGIREIEIIIKVWGNI